MKINRFIALALIALLVVGAMGIVAYSTLAQTPPPDSDDASEESEAQDDDGAALQGQATITAEEAVAAVLAKNPGARVLETELEKEGGRLVWSVELDNGTEAEVDASDGTILTTTGEEDGD